MDVNKVKVLVEKFFKIAQVQTVGAGNYQKLLAPYVGLVLNISNDVVQGSDANFDHPFMVDLFTLNDASGGQPVSVSATIGTDGTVTLVSNNPAVASGLNKKWAAKLSNIMKGAISSGKLPAPSQPLTVDIIQNAS